VPEPDEAEATGDDLRQALAAHALIVVDLQVDAVAAVIAERPQSERQVRIVRGGEAAHSRHHQVGDVGGEAPDHPEGADGGPVVPREHRLARILDHLQTVPSGELHDGTDAAGESAEMHGNHRARARRDAAGHVVGIHAVVGKSDVDEDGLHAVVDDDVRGGDEGGGGNQHLVAVTPAVALPESGQRDLEGARPAVAEHRVGATVQASELGFEALAVRPI
jgi:hypothetical protein